MYQLSLHGSTLACWNQGICVAQDVAAATLSAIAFAGLTWVLIAGMALLS